MFLNTYLSESSLQAFARGDTEQIQRCFIQLPQEPRGRYAAFQMNMIEAPNTGDITGILSVTDVTDQTVSEEILRRLSVTSHDYVVDLNLREDTCHGFDLQRKTSAVRPRLRGCHTERVAFMVESAVVPKDRGDVCQRTAPDEIERRLQEEALYTFAYSVEDEDGSIRRKTSPCRLSTCGWAGFLWCVRILPARSGSSKVC